MADLNKDWFCDVCKSITLKFERENIYSDGSVGMYFQVPFEREKYKEIKPVTLSEGNLSIVMSGQIYNDRELINITGSELLEHEGVNPAYLLLSLYKKYGLDGIKKINGKFAFAIWDKVHRQLILGRDHMGLEPIYYYVDKDKIIFSSSIAPIFKLPSIIKEINLTAVGKFLLFNYNPGFLTFFQNIYRVRPAHVMVADNTTLKMQRYWQLSFREVKSMREGEVAERLLGHLRQSVANRIDHDIDMGVFLSGGMDSSTVISLAAENFRGNINSFSYRCRGESFDESHYARFMADSVGAKHHEVEYSPGDVLSMPDIVREMNEPFCDVGINIASYILGREAGKDVTYVLTGDGGDELFGGHPVYEADKVANYVDALPGIVRNPLTRLFSLLPDSDKKKNIVVKVKRFAESMSYPPELFSHRWRIYYQQEELLKLFSPSLTDGMNGLNLLSDILEFNRQADGPDILSQSLYSDYQTVVDFYLRRNDLNRCFGLETRYPLLDFKLIEFCARMPSRFKINSWFDTKYILKKTVDGLLPKKIIYRKDKLGHSIPLKNWMREDRQVKEFIMDYLNPMTIQKRGFFKPDYIRNLIDDHMTKRRNNSHRLWALAVLEIWMQEHYDNN